LYLVFIPVVDEMCSSYCRDTRLSLKAISKFLASIERIASFAIVELDKA